MPRIYTCFWCGTKGTKKDATVVVSAFTGNAFCTNEKPCKARQRRNERRAKALEAKEAT